MGDPEPNMNERAEEAFAERTLLGVTDEEWHSAMGHVCAMAANGSKLGASILLIKAVREAVRQEREACLTICAELHEHYSGYKDTALLNGDVELSNAASGEPRACEAIAAAIRARSEQ